MILIFCAFGAELGPLRMLLSDVTPLADDHLRGFRGRVGESTVTLIASGIGVRRAQQAVALALDRFYEVDGIITTGVAGALHADLPIGRVVLADRLIVRRGEEFAAEAVVEAPLSHRETFATALGAARITYATGPLLTSRRAIAKVDDKRRAHEALGAIAVDMESAVIALEAAQPRAAVRLHPDHHGYGHREHRRCATRRRTWPGQAARRRGGADRAAAPRAFLDETDAKSARRHPQHGRGDRRRTQLGRLASGRMGLTLGCCDVGSASGVLET